MVASRARRVEPSHRVDNKGRARAGNPASAGLTEAPTKPTANLTEAPINLWSPHLALLIGTSGARGGRNTSTISILCRRRSAGNDPSHGPRRVELLDGAHGLGAGSGGQPAPELLDLPIHARIPAVRRRWHRLPLRAHSARFEYSTPFRRLKKGYLRVYGGFYVQTPLVGSF